jgi:predicted Zn-dependent protease
MADFYQVLVKMNLAREDGGVPTFMSTHPDPGDRYNAVKRDASRWQDSLDLTTWEVNTDKYLALIDGMVYGEDPRQGYVEGQVFYHPEMRFRFPVPTAWFLQNSPLQVLMNTPDGKALMVFTLAPGETLEGAAQATLQQLKVNVLDSQRTSSNGLPAIAVLSNQASQNQSTGRQDTINVLSYFIRYNDLNYVFHGVSAQADFNTYAKVFEPTMTGFAELTEPSKLNKQPTRIRIRKVQNTGTLAQAFQRFGVPQQKMEELAFLNNMDLDERVQAGKMLKIAGD